MLINVNLLLMLLSLLSALHFLALTFKNILEIVDLKLY